MGSGGSDIPRVDEIGGTKAIDHTIRNSAGALVGRLRLYESGTPDGVVCTQLELRLENQSGYFVSPQSWLDAQGYAHRWTGIVAYVNWLRTGQCGNWKMTGASQSWSHFRHSHYTHKILVHDNAEALAAERSAMHSGRCEAYRWGKQTSGPYTEYDWQNSYPRIARDTDMPTKLRGTLT